MRSLLLDQVIWDLTKDASGNIAIASDPYAIAQDAACAIKLFQDELYYDTTKGIPYRSQILGKFPAPQYMRAQFEAAALGVPGAVAAQCVLSSAAGRDVTGTVSITDSAGTVLAVPV